MICSGIGMNTKTKRIKPNIAIALLRVSSGVIES